MRTEVETILEYEEIKALLESKGLHLGIGYYDLLNRKTNGPVYWVFLSEEDFRQGNPFTSCLDLAELRGLSSGMLLQENLVYRIKENL